MSGRGSPHGPGGRGGFQRGGHTSGRSEQGGINTDASNKRPFGATEMASDPDTPSSTPSTVEASTATNQSLLGPLVDGSSNAQSANTSKKEDESKDKRPDFSQSNEVVTLIAGKEDKKFTVHKQFACFYSPVLKAAFNSGFIEGQTQEYTLEYSSTAAVNLLVEWLYRQEITLPNLNSGSEEGIERGLRLTRHLAELWILADKLLMPGLQNSALKGIHRVQTMNGIFLANLPYIYENTTAESPLRRYTATLFAGIWDTAKLFKEFPGVFPPEMVLEVAIIWGNALQNRNSMNPIHLAEFCVPEQ